MVKFAFGESQEEAENIKQQALTTIAEKLLPQLWEARDTGEDLEYAGWKWFFSIVENTLGSEKFQRFLRKYLEDTKKSGMI